MKVPDPRVGFWETGREHRRSQIRKGKKAERQKREKKEKFTDAVLRKEER